MISSHQSRSSKWDCEVQPTLSLIPYTKLVIANARTASSAWVPAWEDIQCRVTAMSMQHVQEINVAINRLDGWSCYEVKNNKTPNSLLNKVHKSNSIVSIVQSCPTNSTPKYLFRENIYVHKKKHTCIFIAPLFIITK
jgi:hypothetical protein